MYQTPPEFLEFSNYKTILQSFSLYVFLHKRWLHLFFTLWQLEVEGFGSQLCVEAGLLDFRKSDYV